MLQSVLLNFFGCILTIGAYYQSYYSGRIFEGSVFEWTTLLAMLVYWIIALAIIKLFLMGKTVSTLEAAAKLDDQENRTTYS